MPYILPKDRPQYFESIDDLAKKIQVKGDFNYVMCELVGQLILKGKIGYTTVSEWIDAMHDAETEARRILLNPYEDQKIEENGMVESWIEILKIMGK
jgi:hypothetical protein